MKNTLVTLAMFFAVAAAYTGTEPVSGEINPIVISDQQWEEWMPLFVSWEVFDPENFQAPPNLLVEFLSQSFAGLYANEYNFDIIRLLEEAGHSADVFARYIENIVIQPDNARIYIQAFGALWLEQMINMLLQDLMEVYHLGGMEYLAGFLAFMEVYEPGAELEQPPRPVWEFTPPTREEIETAFMEALDAQGLDLASHLQETRGHDLSYFMEYVAFYVGVSGESFAFHYGTNWLSILVNELVLDMRAFPEVMQLVGLHSSAISVLGVEEAVRFFDSFFAETIVSVQNQGEMIAALYLNEDFETILADFTAIDAEFLMRLLPDMDFEYEDLNQEPIFEINNDIWLTITPADLEVRHSFSPARSAWYLFDGHVAGAALNIFFRNDSPDEIALTILVINDSVGELEYISQTIAPHSNFVRQIPSNLRVLDINIVTQGGILGGYIQGELAFRFTQGTIDQ